MLLFWFDESPFFGVNIIYLFEYFCRK
jgi:hypothetical protein